ncbi:AAA family ATPase [Patescibacteria group bacterium]|nr:AAA family ATPase [Patescibacteria group bacterium]
MKYTKITISGKICTGKTTLLEKLQQKLRWPTFLTGKLFREYIKKDHLTLEKAEEQNEILTKKVDNQVKDMLKSPGNLIVDGWMSGLSARGLNDVLKVLLVCDDGIRYQRYADRENMPFDDAAKKVEERQTNWFDKIKSIHQIEAKEFTDEKNYDLVIDTSNMNPEMVIDKVISYIKQYSV